MKKMNLLLALGMLLGFLVSCGVAPPTQELNVAKASIAKAQEAKADEFAKDEYAKAQSVLDEGEKGMVNKKNKKNKVAKEKLVEAKKEADAAYAKAAPAYADYNIDLAKKQKLSAEEIKSQVALKDKFAEAQQLLTDSQTDKDAQNFEASWEKSMKATALFEEIFKITKEKKDRAGNALKDAGSSIQNAEPENMDSGK